MYPMYPQYKFKTSRSRTALVLYMDLEIKYMNTKHQANYTKSELSPYQILIVS